nr:hypothetical protein [Spirochaetota bacterium]
RVFSEAEIRKIRSDYLAKIKEKREIKIKKSDFNFIIDKKTLSFDLVAQNYRRNMIISGAITGGAGLIFTGITPLFFSFSNYYKKYYEITGYFYNEAKTPEEINYYYDILKYYGTLNNVYASFSILSLSFGISLSITSFVLFILQNYYIKEGRIIDLNVSFNGKENVNISIGVKL